MKWKNIKGLPSELINEDVLLRIKFSDKIHPYFIMGWISDEKELHTHEDPNGINGGYQCNLDTLHLRKIESVHFVDPRKIEYNQ